MSINKKYLPNKAKKRKRDVQVLKFETLLVNQLQESKKLPKLKTNQCLN